MIPKNKKETFKFTYNMETKAIDLTNELSEAFDGMQMHFDTPQVFADMFVEDEDVPEFMEMYYAIDRGEDFGTADFRVKYPAAWNRVCLVRIDKTQPIATGIVQDVTIRYDYLYEEIAKKEEEMNRRMAKEVEALQLLYAVSQSSDMMMSINLTKNTYYMMSYDDFLRYDPAEVGIFDDLLKMGLDIIPEGQKELYEATFSRKALLDAYAKGEKYVYLEHQQYGPDGVLHWVSTHVMFTENPYSDDVFQITVCRNIDKRKQKEEEQKKMLHDAMLLAEKANEAKSDFLSRMSHDIRTPMNAIIGMATIAATHLDDKEKIKECLNKIGISSRFLLGLINDILDLSKIESGKMTISEEPFFVRELLDSLASNARTLAQQKNQKFQFDVDENIEEVYWGDKVRLEQIFLNLLGNANKYTDEGGKFGLRISRVGHIDDRDVLQFVVEDTGRGISEEFINKIFEPFTQEDESTTRSGSGLGLAIVQNLTHLMDGTISLESKLGEGSRFIVEIPLRGISEDKEAALEENGWFSEDGTKALDKIDQIFRNKGTTEKVSFQGQRVLLVEDNEFNQEVAKTIMEMHNLIVEVADDGYKALEMFRRHREGYYMAIFMDIQMPGIDGYETTRRIRGGEREDGKVIPIYAMTANAFASDVDKARQCGMDGHIAKPVDFDIVARILGEIANKSK